MFHPDGAARSLKPVNDPDLFAVFAQFARRKNKGISSFANPLFFIWCPWQESNLRPTD